MILKMPRVQSILLAACLAWAASGVRADEAPPPPPVGSSATAEGKLSSEFSAFLGGDAQAGAVVGGLRQGTEFTLSDGQVSPTTVTVAPPTGTMGYGNIRIALKLAKAQLNGMGITQPTADQLSAALVGGDINGVAVDGVLTLRSQGMGWGQIARQYGTTVGHLMGKGAGANAAVSGAAGATASTRVASVGGAAHVHHNGYIPSGGVHAGNAGIISAAGEGVGSVDAGGGKGHAAGAGGNGHGAVMASAGGQPASAAGAAGNGKGLALGRQNKN